MCGKDITRLSRHLIAVHKVDPTIARGHRYDAIEAKRKKKKCPLCGRMVTNLLRHLNEVEKIVRNSDEWKDIMHVINVRPPKDANDANFAIFANHPQKDLLLEYTKYRKAVQQRATSTVSKEIKSLMDCLKALNRSGNLEIILKVPEDDRDRVCHLFRARIVNPMKALVKREGDKAASGCYNKLWAMRNFLKWLEETHPIYVSRNNLKPELKSLISNVSAALVPLRASKRMRTTSINKQIEPIDVSEDLPAQALLKSLDKASTWMNLGKVRDYIMTVLAIGSLSRLGALRNMLVDEFQASQPAQEEDMFVVEVKSHKTSKTYGAAGIYFTGFLKRQTERYLAKRMMSSKWVFCTTSGGQLSSSQAAAIFRRLTKTTATCMRKSVAIAHRESTCEVQSAISEAMLHSMAVHRESYAAKAHQSTIYKGLKAVGAVQCLQDSASCSTNREKTPDVPSSEEEMDSVDDGQSRSDDEPIVPQHSISNDGNNRNLRHLISSDDVPPVPQNSLSDDVPETLQSSYVPKNELITFPKPMAAVDLTKWPREYTRQGAVLKGMFVPSRNKFTMKELQLTFKYLGAYRRKQSVPMALLKELRESFAEFDSAFSSVNDKTLIDKIRAWPNDNQLKF